MRFLSGLPNLWRSREVQPIQPVRGVPNELPNNPNPNALQQPEFIRQTDGEVFRIVYYESFSTDAAVVERFSQREDAEFDRLETSETLDRQSKEMIPQMRVRRDTAKRIVENRNALELSLLLPRKNEES